MKNSVWIKSRTLIVKRKNKMLLLIHPDKNPGDCNEVATVKMKELNNACDQKHKEGGKKSKKTQRKRKRKHRASSRH